MRDDPQQSYRPGFVFRLRLAHLQVCSQNPHGVPYVDEALVKRQAEQVESALTNHQTTSPANK